MNARFDVTGTFHLESRGIFVVHGRIAQGTIRRGMFVSLPLGPGADVTAPIRGVEFVDYVGERRAQVALTFDCRDEVARALWAGLRLTGESLTVSERDPAA
jgi:hypothetical protein